MSEENKKTKVLVIGPSLAKLGGQSIQANLILQGLQADADLELAFQPIDPKLGGILGRMQGIKFLRTLITWPLYCIQLFAAIRRADVVHAFSASYLSFVLAPTPAIAMARWLKKPLLLNYHSGEAEDHLARWPSAARWLEKADRIVVPSPFLTRIFAKHQLQTTVIPNAVDLSRLAFRKRGVPRPTFLCNRNFEPHYNVAGVIRAFSLIRKAVPDATLTIAGQGSEAEALRALVTELGSKGIKFVGRIESGEMPSLYDSHDFWLNASRVDNMPLSILEAFSSGTAVVSTSPGGIPDLVSNERTGVLVQCGDDQGLAKACLDLLSDVGRFHNITEVARTESLRYRWSEIGPLWRAIYLSLSGRKRNQL